MSDVYVLLRHVDGRGDDEFTVHGVTDNDIVMETWQAADAQNYAAYFDTMQAPDSEAWQPEEEEEEAVSE